MPAAGDPISCGTWPANGSEGIKADARILLILGAVLFSTGGAAIKGTTLGPWQVAAFRSGVAFIALLVLVPAARRGMRPATVPVAIAYAATLSLFAIANKYTTAASTIFLQSSAPLYLLFLGPWLLGERLERRDAPFIVAMAAGLTLFFVSVDPPSATAPAPLVGNLLGMAAGVTWAFTLLGLRWLTLAPGRGTPAAAAALGNLFAFAACAGLAFPVVSSTSVDWLLILYLGVFQIGIAYALVTAAMHRVTALEASLLLLVEPVLSPVWAWLLHGESPGVLSLLGGAVILTATMARVVARRRSPRVELAPDASIEPTAARRPGQGP